MILIKTMAEDLHAAAIAWAIDTLGASASILNISDFPDNMSISSSIDSKHIVPTHIFKHSRESYNLTDYKSIWNRRNGSPTISPSIHASDVEFIETESREFIKNLHAIGSASNCFEANPFIGKQKANNKLLQLHVAAKSGFIIPDTLISNDIDSIKNFYSAHDGNVIFKSFSPMSWVSKDTQNVRVAYTAQLNESLIASGSAEFCPSIYQERVKKLFEIRVLYAGGDYLAAKVKERPNSSESIDWRIDQFSNRYERFFLDEASIQNMRYIARELDINCGSFDFICDTEGNLVFLEVNEQGQFIFLESFGDNIPAIDFFAKFLISANNCFQYDNNAIALYNDFKKSEYYCDFISNRDETKYFSQRMIKGVE